jgi:hypothetical protein
MTLWDPEEGEALCDMEIPLEEAEARQDGARRIVAMHLLDSDESWRLVVAQYSKCIRSSELW